MISASVSLSVSCTVHVSRWTGPDESVSLSGTLQSTSSPAVVCDASRTTQRFRTRPIPASIVADFGRAENWRETTFMCRAIPALRANRKRLQMDDVINQFADGGDCLIVMTTLTLALSFETYNAQCYIGTTVIDGCFSQSHRTSWLMQKNLQHLQHLQLSHSTVAGTIAINTNKSWHRRTSALINQSIGLQPVAHTNKATTLCSPAKDRRLSSSEAGSFLHPPEGVNIPNFRTTPAGFHSW